MSSWYCKIGERESGPLTSQALRMLAASDRLSPTDRVRRGTEGLWVPASTVRGLFAEEPQPAAKTHSEGAASVGSEWAAAPVASAGPRWTSRDLVGIGAIGISLVMMLIAVTLFAISRRAVPEPLAQGGTSASPSVQSEGPHSPLGSAIVRKAPPNSSAEQSAAAPLAAGPTTADGLLVDGSSSSLPRAASGQPDGRETGLPSVWLGTAIDLSAEGEVLLAEGGIGAEDEFPSAPPDLMLAEPDLSASASAALPVDATMSDEASIVESLPVVPGAPVPSEVFKKQLLSTYEQRSQLLARYTKADADLKALQQQIMETVTAYRKNQFEFLQAKGVGERLVVEKSALIRANAWRGPQLQLLDQQITAIQNQLNGLRQAAMVCAQQNQMLQGQWPAAIKCAGNSFQQFLESRPQWLGFCDVEGVRTRADQSLVVGLCDEWLGESVEFPEAVLLRGWARVNLAEFAPATSDFELLLNRIAEDAPLPVDRAIRFSAALGLSKFYIETGKEREALNELARLQKQYPRSPVVYVFRGRANARFGRIGAAVDDYAQATRLNETSWVPYREVAWLLATAGNERDGRRAVELGRKACELTQWNEWRALETYARAQAEVSDFEEAVKWAAQAVDSAPEHAQEELSRRLQLYKAGVAPNGLQRL